MEKNDIGIYLVSLEQDSDRREKLKSMFPSFYNLFNLINAVDGRKVSAKDYYTNTFGYFLRNRTIMSPAEFGCTLSHIKTLETFLKTEQQYALIFEDDVLGRDCDINAVLNILPSIPENTVLICGGQDGIKTNKYIYGKKAFHEHVYKIHPLSYKYVFRTCCYAVTRKSAYEIVKYHESKLTLADKWSEFFRDNDIFLCYIECFSHPRDLSNSHIEQDRKNQQKITLFKKIFSFGVVFRIYRLFRKVFVSTYCKLSGYEEVVKGIKEV
ncbi:glycosyltransferase family 25 protein [Seleniivibrio woodruffii]|uniref:glycosyltransferase family 25 protein n=1 Tax=Seleniivibrio woodruffii TaxID=1078050 RepID=UPI0026E94B9F|nr:glycosyltransferase family 25 protein [Seleniivibrio woodruffii]